MSDFVVYLILITFGLAIVFAAHQWFRTSKARREHHHSQPGCEAIDNPPVRVAQPTSAQPTNAHKEQS